MPDRFHDRVRPLCARCFQGQQHRLHSQTDQERGASPGIRQASQTVGAASGRVCRADEPLRDFAFARFFDPVPRQAGAADARRDRLFPYFGRAGFGSDPRRKNAAGGQVFGYADGTASCGRFLPCQPAVHRIAPGDRRPVGLVRQPPDVESVRQDSRADRDQQGARARVQALVLGRGIVFGAGTSAEVRRICASIIYWSDLLLPHDFVSFMKFIRYVLGTCLFLGVSTFGCERPWAGEEYFWELQNNSDKNIRFCVSLKWEGKYLNVSTRWPEVYPYFQLVKPGQMRSYTVAARQMARAPRDSFAVYVFDPDTLAMYTMEELERDSNYLKRYLFGDVDENGQRIGSKSNPIVYP